MTKDRIISTISSEMRERQRIISRMTPKEKQVHKWRCYDKKAKLQLLELIEYCQSDDKICPLPQKWNKIYHDYSWHTDKHSFTKYPPLRAPLILGAWNTSDIEKRQRFLTQIYWCYKNYFMGSVYNKIMNFDDNDWHLERYPEDNISLDLVKKEYARWLGVKYHPEYDIWNYCVNHYEKDKKIQIAKALYKNQSTALDDESITLIESR